VTSTRQTLADPAFSDAEGRAEPLRYLNLFRLVLAGLFLVAGPALNLGGDSPTIFFGASFAYLAAVLILGFPDAERLLGRSRLITLQVLVDVTLLTLIMWASGGYRSGMPILILIALAGAGLVGQGRMVLFYAAYATLAVLLENAFRLLSGRATVDFFTVGITCIGFFAIAQVARLLALRALANEDLARQRGADLASQLRLNRQIIQDMQDGVLVVGEDGRVRQFNPRAAVLLGTGLREGGPLSAYAPALARTLQACGTRGSSSHSLRAEGSGTMLLARFLPAGEANETLVYLEDFDRIHNQIQQAKLAALGRLTASIAHEIRNPLAAIAQANALLAEDAQPGTQQRLTTMVADNVTRLKRIVDDVLAVAPGLRQDAPAIECLPLVAHCCTEWLHTAPLPPERAAPGELCAMQLELPAPSASAPVAAWLVRFDGEHLRRVLVNLLDNGWRHSSQTPGAIRVTLQIEEHEERPSLIHISVLSDGEPIPRGVEQSLFEPFFSTRSRGTGLGLYICRELCERYGARIDYCQHGPDHRHRNEFRLTLRGELAGAAAVS